MNCQQARSEQKGYSLPMNLSQRKATVPFYVSARRSRPHYREKIRFPGRNRGRRRRIAGNLLTSGSSCIFLGCTSVISHENTFIGGHGGALGEQHGFHTSIYARPRAPPCLLGLLKLEPYSGGDVDKAAEENRPAFCVTRL